MRIHLLDVLIIGAGMYVCGRGTGGCGTILPAVMQAYRDGLVQRIRIAGTTETSMKYLKGKVQSLNGQLGMHLNIQGYPEKGSDPLSYRKALAELSAHGAVIVAVPDHLHGEIVRDVLEMNKPVLVVKPFTKTLREGRELCHLAEKKNLYGMVEFHKRWDLANRKLHEVLYEQRLGTPLYALVEFSQRKQVPQEIFHSWSAHTNVFQYLGVHYVDLLYHILKAVPQRVMAMGQFAYLQEHHTNTYDAIQVMIEWKLPNSSIPFTSTLLVNWIDPNSTSAMSYQSIKIVGTKGRYESDQKCRGQQLVTDENGVEEINPYFTQSYLAGAHGKKEYLGYGIESIRTFLTDVHTLLAKRTTLEELAPSRPTFRQALVSVAVAEAVESSLQSQGAWISISPL